MSIEYRQRNVNGRIFYICTFFAATIASSIFIISFFVLAVGLNHLDNSNSGMLSKFSCLLPIGAFNQAFKKIKYFEVHGMI